MESNLTRLVADLGWSLWTELGISGTERRHQRMAIDPEPLIVHAGWMASLDLRLRDEIFRWCAAHSEFISASRLRGLLREVPEDVHMAFFGLSEALAQHTTARWPRAKGVRPWPLPRPRSAFDAPLTRPSMLRLRLRTVSGVGTRADVLAELLGRAATWTTAADLEVTGYSKRNIARILAELNAGTLLRVKAEKNTLTYQLEEPRLWERLASASGLAWPHWMGVFAFAHEATRLEALEEQPIRPRRVAATKCWRQLSDTAIRLGLPRPPEARGNPDIWELLLAWATPELRALADGSSAALRVHRLTAAAQPSL